MMQLPIPEIELSRFLVEAKNATYASGTDQYSVPAALPASHQLEYQQGDLSYKDIYFGGLAFIGVETAYFSGKPIWGMSYYGTVLSGSGETQLAGMPPFLKAALRELPREAPYRGPESFQQGDYRYANEIHGQFSQFHGTEIIYHKEQAIYQLHYSGGVIR